MQLLMMYTRAAFYATEPSNAAVYAPVEACGAHEWSCIVHGWRAFAATQPPTQRLEDTKTGAKSEGGVTVHGAGLVPDSGNVALS